jgi:predicted transcriptional regulator
MQQEAESLEGVIAVINTNDVRLASIRYVDLGKDGIEMFYGPLEAECLRAVWAGRKTTKAIWQWVQKHYTPQHTEVVSYTTVTTAVDRLHRKNAIVREEHKNRQRAYLYQPAYKSEEAFLAAIISHVIEAIYDASPYHSARFMRLILDDHDDTTIDSDYVKDHYNER